MRWIKGLAQIKMTENHCAWESWILQPRNLENPPATGWLAALVTVTNLKLRFSRLRGKKLVFVGLVQKWLQDGYSFRLAGVWLKFKNVGFACAVSQFWSSSAAFHVSSVRHWLIHFFFLTSRSIVKNGNKFRGPCLKVVKNVIRPPHTHSPLLSISEHVQHDAKNNNPSKGGVSAICRMTQQWCRQSLKHRSHEKHPQKHGVKMFKVRNWHILPPIQGVQSL